ncbi:hypothetical protein BS47DRAFT_1352564 [Hydnum rufescens UP504]|uniref:Uncharacterized protein n=1 Tax=Hydnum rufescens UP504 TaxID=1448309 RepID=A0A9P6AIV3_9AGAM|nr:hypothetical protein BS47DRAFT_1352564 [Hydnum rufescens UP504]
MACIVAWLRTDSIINRMALYTISTGLITSILSCIVLVMFARDGSPVFRFPARSRMTMSLSNKTHSLIFFWPLGMSYYILCYISPDPSPYWLS